MRIAIDIDGTIDTSKHLWELTKDNEVYFVTTKYKSIVQRIEQLKKLGIEGYKDIIIVDGSNPGWIGYNKAQWIKEHDIDVVFENSIINIDYIKDECPNVECFLLV